MTITFFRSFLFTPLDPPPPPLVLLRWETKDRVDSLKVLIQTETSLDETSKRRRSSDVKDKVLDGQHT